MNFVRLALNTKFNVRRDRGHACQANIALCSGHILNYVMRRFRLVGFRNSDRLLFRCPTLNGMIGAILDKTLSALMIKKFPVYYGTSDKIFPLDLTLNRLILVITINADFMMRFNTIIPRTTCPPRWHFRLKFSGWHFVHIYCLPYVLLTRPCNCDDRY